MKKYKEFINESRPYSNMEEWVEEKDNYVLRIGDKVQIKKNLKGSGVNSTMHHLGGQIAKITDIIDEDIKVYHIDIDHGRYFWTLDMFDFDQPEKSNMEEWVEEGVWLDDIENQDRDDNGDDMDMYIDDDYIEQHRLWHENHLRIMNLINEFKIGDKVKVNNNIEYRFTILTKYIGHIGTVIKIDKEERRVVVKFKDGESGGFYPEWLDIIESPSEDSNMEEWIEESQKQQHFKIGDRVSYKEGSMTYTGTVYRYYGMDIIGVKFDPNKTALSSGSFDIHNPQFRKRFTLLEKPEDSNTEEWIEEKYDDFLGIRDNGKNTWFEKIKKEREQYKKDVISAANRIVNHLKTRQPNPNKYIHPLVLKYKKRFSVVKSDVDRELLKLNQLLNQ